MADSSNNSDTCRTSRRSRTAGAGGQPCTVEGLEGRSYFSAIVPSHVTKFMAMGDSITAGQAFNGSYRLPLQNELKAGGYKYQFVGGSTAYSQGMAQPNHEGRGGYSLLSPLGAQAGTDSFSAGTWYKPNTFGQLYGNDIQNALTTYKPDVILFMAGINDVYGIDALNLDNRAREYQIVLNQIFSLEPNVKLICAPVTYKRGELPDSILDAANVKFQAVAQSFKAKGYDVQWATQAGGGPGGSITSSPHDAADHIHPNNADTYGRMANGFFNAIVEGTVGDTEKAPTVSAPNAQIITLPNSAHLSVAVHSPTGAHLSETWSQVAGPGKVTFTNVHSNDTHASFSAPGIYQVRLTVTDGRLYSTKDVEVTVGAAGHAPAVPSGPRNAYAVTSPGSMVLHWADTSNNETDYVIQRASNPNFTWYLSTFVAPANTTSYSIPNIVKGQTFYLRVWAVNTVGASAYSSTVVAVAK